MENEQQTTTTDIVPTTQTQIATNACATVAATWTPPDAVRASSLPLGFLCAQSLRRPNLKIGTAGEPAGVGSCVHRGLASHVSGYPSQVALDAAEGEFPSVDMKEVTKLFWNGVRVWSMISHRYPNAKPEVFASATVNDGTRTVKLTGHLDVLSLIVEERLARLLDWKSGFLDHDYKHQGLAYAVLVLLNHPEIDTVEVDFAWLRTRELETYTLTRDRMNQWLELLMAQIADEEFSTGKHCAHCHRNHECPAVVAMVRRDVAMFSDRAIHDVANMPDPDLCAFRRRLKTLSTLIEEALEHSRTEIAKRGGEIRDGVGGVIHFVEQGGRRELDTVRAAPILAKYLSKEQLLDCTSISIAQAEKIVMANAGKGNGAGAKRVLTADLTQAGALTQPTTTKLIDERIK